MRRSELLPNDDRTYSCSDRWVARCDDLETCCPLRSQRPENLQHPPLLLKVTRYSRERAQTNLFGKNKCASMFFSTGNKNERTKQAQQRRQRKIIEKSVKKQQAQWFRLQTTALPYKVASSRAAFRVRPCGARVKTKRRKRTIPSRSKNSS